MVACARDARRMPHESDQERVTSERGGKNQGDDDGVFRHRSGCSSSRGPALPDGKGLVCRRHGVAAAVPWRRGAVDPCPRKNKAHRRRGGARGPRRPAGADRCRRRRGSDRRHPAPLHAGALGRPEGLRHDPAGAAGGSRALRRRSCRVRRGRDRAAGARCRRADRGRLRAVAGRGQRGRRHQVRRAQDLGRLPQRQCRRDHRLRRQGCDRCRLRQGQACRHIAPGEQSRRRQCDRAALRDRTLQRRSVHALHDVAGSARAAQQARVVRLPRSGNQDPRGVPGRRRRLRHEVQHLSR